MVSVLAAAGSPAEGSLVGLEGTPNHTLNLLGEVTYCNEEIALLLL